MSSYVPTGPFNNGAAPGITAEFLNAVEAFLDLCYETANHTKAAHDALDIDAATLEGFAAAAFALSGHDHDADYEALGHTHPASEIDSGTLPVNRGGTGRASGTDGYYPRWNGTAALDVLSPASVLADIGAAAAGHDHGAQVIYGSYTGDGNATRTISIGVDPDVVFVFGRDNNANQTMQDVGVHTQHQGMLHIADPDDVLQRDTNTGGGVVSGGFQVGGESGGGAQGNLSGRTYYYLAFVG